MAEQDNVEILLRDKLKPSIVRTLVPLIIAGLSYVGLSNFIDETVLTTLVSQLLSLAYYTLARVLETKNSKWSVLLGSKSVPSYGDGKSEQSNPDLVIEDRGPTDQEIPEVIQESNQGVSSALDEKFINEFILGQE